MTITPILSGRTGKLPAALLAAMLLASPWVLQAEQEQGAEAPCEFTFIPESPAPSGEGEPVVAGRIQASPGCEYFYFPGVQEKELVRNPDLWKYTGEKSHFRITPDGRLLFIPARVKDSGAKGQAPLTPAGTAAEKPPAVSDSPQPGANGEQARQAAVLAEEKARLLARLQQESAQKEAELAAMNRTLESRLEQLRLAMQRREQQFAALQQEQQAKIQALEARLLEAGENLAAAERGLEQVMGEKLETAAELDGCGQRLESCSAALHEQRRETGSLQARLAGLEGKLETLVQASRDSDGDGVPDARDACPDTPPKLATDSSGCVSIDLPGIEFATGSARLNWKSRALLNHAAVLLKELGIRVEVQGHTDSTGNPALNKVLSRKRAEAVAAYLASQGVKPENLVARGYGDEQPIADNGTAEGRARNRRVTLVRIRE